MMGTLCRPSPLPIFLSSPAPPPAAPWQPEDGPRHWEAEATLPRGIPCSPAGSVSSAEGAPGSLWFPGDARPSPEPQELPRLAGSASAQAGARYQQARDCWGTWQEWPLDPGAGRESPRDRPALFAVLLSVEGARRTLAGPTPGCSPAWDTAEPMQSCSCPPSRQPGLLPGSGSRRLGRRPGGWQEPQLCCQTDEGSQPGPAVGPRAARCTTLKASHLCAGWPGAARSTQETRHSGLLYPC